MSRNDAFSDTAPGSISSFAAKLNEGENCWALEIPPSPGYPGGIFFAGSDAVRSGFSGSCAGTASSTRWGRHERPSVSDWPITGVLCCAPSSAPATPTWKAMGTKTAQVMTGSCAHTTTATIACNVANIGVEARVNATSNVELKPTSDGTGWLQGQSATVSGSNITLTGATGCGGDSLQSKTVTYYVCAY